MNSPQPDSRAEGLVLEGVPLGQVCRDVTACFRKAGLPTPELDARLIVCHGFSVTHEQLISDPQRLVGREEAQRIHAMTGRRLAREPVSRILGQREFHGLEFALGPETLDPRPDTETLVQAALDLVAREWAGDEIAILDLGTGSGCILVSLLHALPNARGVGVDISTAALEVARENAKTHAVDDRAKFLRSEWTEHVEGQFDLVVSNPPYIATSEIAGLEPEVSRFDPDRALDGGEDGLAAYRRLIPGLGRIVSPGGWVVLEIGAGQENAVAEILGNEFQSRSAGNVRRWPDLSGHIRCLGAKHSPNSK